MIPVLQVFIEVELETREEVVVVACASTSIFEDAAAAADCFTAGIAPVAFAEETLVNGPVV